MVLDRIFLSCYDVNVHIVNVHIIILCKYRMMTVTTTKRRVTIKDVATRAEVSYQTVSRVINHHPNVRPQTRVRVLEAIKTLNFRPNLAARSLPQRRSFIIGLIIPYVADDLFRDPNLLDQISGIDIEANAHGYNLLLSTAGDANSGLEAFERFLRNQVADGALVIETSCSEAGCRMLAQANYPYVSLGYDPYNPGAYYVHCDDWLGAEKITRHLLEKGHRRIGIINGPATGATTTTDQRLRGHQKAMQQAGLAFDPVLMVYGDYTRAGGQRATEQLLGLPEPPTAIFAFNDRMAMGAVRALHAVGLNVPRDVAVAGFDNIPTAADFSPALTTVQQPGRQIGHVAAKMLFDLIAGVPVPNRKVVLPAEFIIRQSA
jgi:DNA-binding LacI/PurR family transcriptional regulator